MQLGKTTVTAMCFSLLLAGADVRSATRKPFTKAR